MFLTLTVSVEVWADYTITFKTGSGSEVTTKAAIINSGADYVLSVSASKTYAESDGLRYGSSSDMGYTTFTLSNAGQIKASKIIFQGAKYYSSDNSSLQYTITYTDASTTSGTIVLTSTATDKEATLESSKTISKIDIRKTANSKKRFYVQGVEVVSAAVANHTVTFDAGSGSCSTSKFTQTSTTRSVNLPPASTTCEGWTFAGWCTSSAGNQDENSTSPGTILLPGTSYTPSSTHTLYAVYTRSESGGTATSYVKVSADNVTTGTYVIAAIRSSSVSSNYYPATGSISSGDMVVSDKTFTLTNETFTEIPDDGIEFTFTGDNTNGFTINNGSGNLGYTSSSSSRKLAFGNYTTKWKVYDHDNPQAGVYLQHSDGSSYYTITENSTSTTPIRGYASETKYRSIYLFKKGSASTTYYMTNLTCATQTAITLNPDGGTISANVWTHENGVYKLTTNDESITLPEITRIGYDFVEWNTNADGTGTDYAEGATIDLDGTAVDLHAIWTPITYTITYELDGGTNHASNPANYTIETETITLQKPSKQGCDFVGWYKESTFATQVTQITKGSTEDITLYAKWEKAKTATSLSWSAATYSATIDVDNTFPTLTINPEAIKESVQYTSSKETIATIDANGNITLVAAGTTTITATFTETATHTGATASYTLTVHPSNCRWVEIALEDITPEDEIVVTMGNDEIGYALGTEKITNSPKSQAITITSGMIDINQDFDYSKYTWSISAVTGGYTLQPYGTTDTYLYGVTSYISIGNNNTNNIFTIFTSPENGNKCFAYVIGSNAYFLGHGKESNQDAWKQLTSYKSLLASNTLKFYKKTCLPANKFWIDYELANVTCTNTPPHSQIAKSETLALNFEAAIGYALPDNVTVTGATPSWNKATGTLTISNPTDNVTITIEALKLHTITWMVGSSSVLSEDVANGTGVTQTPSDPADDAIGSCANKFRGWSETPLGSAEGQSAPSDLCTAAQMKSKHSSVTGDKTFYAVFATSGVTTGGTVEASLSFASTAQRDSQTSSKQVWSNEGITFTNNKGSSTTDVANYSNPVRLYKNSEIIVEHTSGEITKIVFDCNSSTYATALKNSIGTPNSNTTVTVSSDKVTVTFANAVASFSAKLASDQVRLDALTVTAGGGTITTYSNYVTNCCATPVPTNGSYTSPSGTSVTLTWDGESTQYHITGNGLDDYSPEESYTITGLTECDEYTFYVSAYPEGGCESEAIAITAQPFSGAKTVTFNYNGNGQANTTSSTSCGNTSITLPTPSWTGYRFMGWFNAASGGTKIGEAGASYKPTDDIPLYAQWEKEYNVTYNANGGSTTCAGGAYIAGETVIVCTTNPTRTGHTFTGWTYSPNVTITDGKFVMPASDVTITAQWQINSYTVTWNPNGGNWGGSTASIVETYEYGATIVQPAAPQQDGYRFTGWNYSIPATMPAGNATYTAQWKQNYTITFYDGNDVTPWTQTKDAESINLTEYLGTLACDDYQFAGWSTADTKYNDETANITTWVTGNYTPTANIDLYAVYSKGAVTNDFTLNCAGGVYEIWVNNSAKNHMAGQRNDSYNLFTKEYWDSNKTGSNGAPFTITRIAENTYTIQNAEGHYIAKHSNDTKLDIESEWQNLDRYKWTVSAGTNGSWRFTNKAVTTHALIYYNNYFRLYTATSVTNGSTSYYDLELTPAASNVYQSNPNCGPYYIRFETHGGEFIQGEYAYGEEQTGLTETTYSKFPAAELEGYTFAGWKDGSPIEEEITADNPADGPYLKQAGEDLVVSSNKTYHAVYYYYDEEEDIDFSKEFITSIYVDINEMQYFLSGTPNADGGRLSATTDCGSVSEVTITPGTGANAGQYAIKINGVSIAPRADETDIVGGSTAWWTIEERSPGSGEYKISGQDKTNIVYIGGGFGHYKYNQGSDYGANYYYPHFGICRQHHWVSFPTLKPSINLSGDVYVTATNARGIMAISTLKVSAKQLNANEKVNITSNSNDVYFSADRTVNFVKANKPVNTLTITASASGVIEQDIYVHYKPSTEGNGTPASVVVSANLATPNPSVTDDQTIYVRNMPAKFVIATKVGATWYALPADMSSATNPLGVVIEVDETTMTTIAPNTTTYTLWPVKTTATEYDRYTNVTGAAYGDRVRFAAVNYEQRGLWANNNNNGSTIRDYAKIDALGADALAAYEWKITTTVVDGNWQYTLQTDQDKNQNFLRYWTSAEGTPVGPKWGTYNAGENKLYFLPVTETQPFEYAVVEWYPTKVLIQTDAAITSPSVKVDGEAVASPILTNKGGKLYEISNLPLETNPNKLLQISFTDNAINYTNTKVVPIILSRGAKTITGEPFATLTQKVYQYADVVVRDGATLSIDGTTDVANTLLGVTIYPTAKVSVDNGKKLSVHNLTFFGGIDEIYDGSTYKINKYGVPQLSLKGILNKTVTTIDYIMRVNLDQMYSLTVPYDVQLADIKYWDGSDIALGTALYVSAYDGEARANQSKKTWIYETDFNPATLKAGVGYTISAELQAGVGNEYSILRMPMNSNVASGDTEDAKTVAVTAWGNDANVSDNHKGWNLVGNPYMTTIQGADDADLVLGYLKETGTGPWEWVEKTYRYVTIPADNGKDYHQQKFTEAVLPPFKNFFVQVGTTGELVFDLGTRQSMPARSTQAAIEKEVEFEILMSNDARQDNTGLLISEEYSPAYEINADLEKMIGSMSVYTIYGGYKLAYNALSPINASEWIPMGYIAPTAGEYTFRIDDVDKIMELVEHVYVIDYDANNIVDLMTDEYKFTTDKEQNDNRFAINVVLIQDKDNTTTDLDIINGNNTAPIKFIYHDKIYIKSGEVIYDGTGKQVTNINK